MTLSLMVLKKPSRASLYSGELLSTSNMYMSLAPLSAFGGCGSQVMGGFTAYGKNEMKPSAKES